MVKQFRCCTFMRSSVTARTSGSAAERAFVKGNELPSEMFGGQERDKNRA
jgi:hypothetical protein